VVKACWKIAVRRAIRRNAERRKYKPEQWIRDYRVWGGKWFIEVNKDNMDYVIEQGLGEKCERNTKRTKRR